MSIAYHKDNVTIVFKTSNRSNARFKMKTFRNKCIDDILEKKKRSYTRSYNFRFYRWGNTQKETMVKLF
jgi:hypothetical protein